MEIEHDDDKVARAVMALAKKSRDDDAEISSAFWEIRMIDAAPSAMIKISGILSLNDAGKCSP